MVKQRAYLWVTVSIVIITLLFGTWRDSFDLVNIALLYLLPVLLSAVYGGRGPSLYAATLGLLSFDFFFVPPYLSFAVSDLRYIATFVVFYIVATLTASLAAQLKRQLRESEQKGAYTASLYAISKELSAFTDIQALLRNVSQQVSNSIRKEAAIYLPNRKDELELSVSSSDAMEWGGGEAELAIADWVYRNGSMAGKGAARLSGSSGLYIPLRTEDRIHGVLGVNLGNAELSKDNLFFLEALGGLAASAIARVKLSEEAKLAHLTAESERLRTAILDSVSHELRTPLATIIGSASAMIEGDRLFSDEDRMDLLHTIRDGALRMNRLVSNLLGMVQLESGMLRLRQDWCDAEDIIGVVLKQVEDFQKHRRLVVRLPEQVPIILGDEVLLEQVMTNVVSNAIKYSPDYSEITIEVKAEAGTVSIAVADTGMGIEESERERVFDKFYRAKMTSHVPGTGLGLAICKGIVELHGGTITAEPNGARGTVMTITLPAHREAHAIPNDREGSIE
ncbi:DUF4118 domain-containing protein [Paenibacillus sp. LHD-117]|uniref:DUF4118 domain-containing protein n=1 Tax=Paenibacillus sp. LHD-117 TaxID=3071412 RepID=UPI0027E0B39E|nr:DUF4118 domain-containing protein [Paenibacillus sp. LHD-117]MDQ6421715.1 DUF4118 domain-containing protein [Paenibacillus sp. LHD-117]